MSPHQRPVMGPPETPSRFVQQSPSLFPTLQLSPDLYAHQFTPGPLTAPAYSHQRPFWDPSSAPFDEPIGAQPYHDAFQLSPVALSNSFASAATVVPSYPAPESLPEELPYDLPSMPRSSSFSHMAGGPAFPAPFTTSPRVPAPQLDNPNLFLSSPARRFGAIEHPSTRFGHHLVPERPAYAHQIEESRREQELKRLRRADVKPPSISRSVAEALRRPVSPVKEARPGLKRSLTHTGVRGDRGLTKLHGHGGLAGRMSPAPVDRSRSHRSGRSSPLKAIPEPVSRGLATSRTATAKRTSLSLAIDENGVAKTVVMDSPFRVGLDPVLGSEAESIDDGDMHLLYSQGPSLALSSDVDPSHPPSTGGRAYAHSKTSSYSTLGSATSARQSSQPSSASSVAHRRGSDGQQGHRRKRNLPSSAVQADTLLEDEPLGNAQCALRAIIQDRSRSTDNLQAAQLHSSPPLLQTKYHKYNASPTTITDPELATPSTDRESLSSTISTRCVCNTSFLDGTVPMIQCDTCAKWLHTTCIGVNGRHVPEVYVCAYCMQSPTRPGHPVLRPSAFPSVPSPLAHKSKRYG